GRAALVRAPSPLGPPRRRDHPFAGAERLGELLGRGLLVGSVLLVPGLQPRRLRLAGAVEGVAEAADRGSEALAELGKLARPEEDQTKPEDEQQVHGLQ